MKTRASRLLEFTFFQPRVAPTSRVIPVEALTIQKTDALCLQPTHPRRHAVVVRQSLRMTGSAVSATLARHSALALYIDPEFPSFGDFKAPDERTLRLGKTVSILHERLPTLLAAPLPQDILSPQINLHLFPSTHPHLPTVSGRLSYTAALWTAPVAWGRVPVVGNVKLEIISERMVKSGSSLAHKLCGRPSERLIVRWKTCSKDAGQHGVLDFLHKSTEKATESARAASDDSAGAARQKDDDESCFTGLFIFEFDELGRISKHTIENAQQGGNWERMTRVVSVTDWLLGLAKRRRAEEESMALGFADEQCPDVVFVPASQSSNRRLEECPFL